MVKFNIVVLRACVAHASQLAVLRTSRILSCWGLKSRLCFHANILVTIKTGISLKIIACAEVSIGIHPLQS